jgi:cytochrome c biogenesis protein CcdA
VIALEGDFAYSFILGVLAAVNPCGFILLPTYLLYYLGTELNRESESPATTLRRGLTVGVAVSSGFIGLFLIVGIISRAFTTVIRDNAKYAALIIGIGLIAMGIAMFRGWKPPVAQPNMAMKKQRTWRNMFVFGIAYAVASIGCTIGLLISVILGSVGRHGFVSGVLSIALYGLGMGLLVTSLTVALAFARFGLVSNLKKSFPFFDKLSAVAVVITGLYLTWYWFGAITNRGSDGVVGRVEELQTNVATFLQNTGAYLLAAIFITVIAAAVIVMRRSSPREN